ncbi:MAG: MliC family protein [Synergistaceae bacterium]|nr:MliC family protein [Synergistaceae bacterium]
MSRKICNAAFVLITLTFPVFLASSSFAAGAGDALFVFQGGALHVLERVPSDSGERYEEKGDSSSAFEARGRKALLTVGGREYSRYVLIRDMNEDEFALTVDGENFSMKSAISASGAKYEAAEDPNTVFWSKGDSVTLTVRGDEYEEYNIWQLSGIIWLTDEPFPTGIEWRVKSVLGTETIGDSSVTLTFLGDRTLHGNASVNSYISSWLSSGCRLIIRPPVETKKMGPPDLMEQEGSFLRALPGVVAFRLKSDGVTLITKEPEDIELTF